MVLVTPGGRQTRSEGPLDPPNSVVAARALPGHDARQRAPVGRAVGEAGARPEMFHTGSLPGAVSGREAVPRMWRPAPGAPAEITLRAGGGWLRAREAVRPNGSGAVSATQRAPVTPSPAPGARRAGRAGVGG